MSVAAVSSHTPPPQVMQKPESVEPKTVGADHDGDKDDGAGAAAVKPTSNSAGQPLGLLVNAKA